MFKAWEKILRGLLSDGVVPERLYSKRSRGRGIPSLSDREIFWCLNFSNPDLSEIVQKVDERDYEEALIAFP